MPTATKKLTLFLGLDLLARIDAWMREQELVQRSHAVRLLIKRGLRASEEK